MAQARRKKAETPGIHPQVSKGLREGTLFILSALAAYLLLSLMSYYPQDPGWSHRGPANVIHNFGGLVGAWFADVFLYLFGYLAYLFPLMVGFSGWLVFRGRNPSGGIDMNVLSIRWAGFLLTVASGCGLATLHFIIEPGTLPLDAGGVFGKLVGDNLADLFNPLGATLFLLALFLTGGLVLVACYGYHRQVDVTGAGMAGRQVYTVQDPFGGTAGKAAARRQSCGETEEAQFI